MQFSAASLSTHLVIMALTLSKQLLGDRVAWGRTPLVQLVMRDGTLAFLFVVCTYSNAARDMLALAYQLAQ